MTPLEELLSQTETLEREQMDQKTAHALDRLASRLSAVRRYRIVRKYAIGKVVDAACGCGFGAWLVNRNPDVDSVVGFDIETEVIDYARTHYPDETLTFEVADICSSRFGERLKSLRPDTILSIETLEHLSDVESFARHIVGSGATRWVVTFPSFATVHFNPYHLRDLVPEEVAEMVGAQPAKMFVVDDAVHVLVFDL